MIMSRKNLCGLHKTSQPRFQNKQTVNWKTFPQCPSSALVLFWPSQQRASHRQPGNIRKLNVVFPQPVLLSLGRNRCSNKQKKKQQTNKNQPKQANNLSSWVVARRGVHATRNPRPRSLQSFELKIFHLSQNLSIIIWSITFTSASKTTDEYGPGLLTIRETLTDSTSVKIMPRFATWWVVTVKVLAIIVMVDFDLLGQFWPDHVGRE